MNNYMKLLANLANVDVEIEEEDKTLILLSFLPDKDCETFVLTVINGNQSLGYKEVSTALGNHNLRTKDKESSNTTLAEALTVRNRSSSWKGKGDRGRSKSRADFRYLKKNRVLFAKRLGNER